MDWKYPWRYCLMVAMFALAMQITLDAVLDIRRPNSAPAITAFHPAFPDALNFQRQKTELLAGLLREKPGQIGLAASAADPHIWLGAFLMGLTFPDELPLLGFNALCHALLAALLVWHLRRRITTRWHLWNCGLLLPSFYLWSSQLLRDPFLWLVFWALLWAAKVWLGGVRKPVALVAGLAVMLSAAWLYEEKKPVFMVCLGAALVGPIWISNKRWIQIGMAILLLGAGWLGEWGFWARGLAASSRTVFHSFSPAHRQQLAAEVELRSQAQSGIPLDPQRRTFASRPIAPMSYLVSVFRNLQDGLASGFSPFLGTGGKQGWVWLLIPLVDACSLSWLGSGFRQEWARVRGSAMRAFLLICGLGLLVSALFSITHFGNAARNLSWFFLCAAYLAGFSRAGGNQGQAR